MYLQRLPKICAALCIWHELLVLQHDMGLAYQVVCLLHTADQSVSTLVLYTAEHGLLLVESWLSTSVNALLSSNVQLSFHLLMAAL